MIEQNDHRVYSDAEKQRLTSNLAGVAAEIHGGGWNDKPACVATLCALHARVFAGVRDHAGRTRSKDWGTERLVFGPNRSFHRSAVARALDEAFDSARRSIRSLQENKASPDYEHSAVYVAVWIHAEIVRIHPFEDGNGRSSRLLMAMVLVQLGLRPIPVEATKQEYTNQLNTYFRSRTIQPLIDLFLRIADPGQAERPSDS
ncbi:MAG: Fic family protein [Planctomycetes bacterium]|nr:Fic family protein [Planctomycetota bacterium]